MKVLTLIVSYNFEPWMDRCLNSLSASEHPTDVLVVDNGSTDRTRERIGRDFPHVRLIENGRNLGFGCANNIGLRIALAEGYDAVFLLNQDAWIKDDTIGTLCELSARHPDYGILSPVHMDGSGRQLDRGFAAYAGINKKRPLESLTEELVECPFINAAFWWIPVPVLRTVGGFSPLFYHYGEDKDYVNRLHFHGLKVGYSPRIFGFHDRAYRQTDRTLFFRMERVFHLSEYANINHSLPAAFLYGPAAILPKAAECLVHLYGKNTWEYLRICLSLIGKTGRILQTRRTTRCPHPNYIEP